MTQEELIKKIKKATLEILMEEKTAPQEGLEAIHSNSFNYFIIWSSDWYRCERICNRHS